ncbi:hypothetical protein ACDI16_12460 [Oceanobacillus caeni]
MPVLSDREYLDRFIDTSNMTDEEIETLIKQLSENWYGEPF